MATVIDSLFIELGLNTSKFNTEQKKAVESLRQLDIAHKKSAANIQQGIKNTADSFDKAKGSLVAFGTALVTVSGFGNFITSMVHGNAELSRTAERLQITEKDLAAWGGVMATVHGTTDDFAKGLGSLQQRIASINAGNQDDALFVTASKLGTFNNGISLSGIKIFELADAFKRLHDTDPQKALLLGGELGFSNAMYTKMILGGEELKKQFEEQKKLVDLNAESAKNAAALEAAAAKFATALQGIRDRIMDKLYKALEKLVVKATELLQAFKEWDTELDGMPTKTLAWAAATLTLVTALKALAKVTALIFGGGAAAAGAGAGGGIGAGAAKKGFGAFLLKRLPWLGLLYSEDVGEGSDIVNRYEKHDATGKFPQAVQQPASSANESQAAKFAALEKKYGLPSGMLDAIWSLESGRGKGDMISPKGATGHFQFMPKTAAQYGLSREDTFNLEKSSDAAAHMMSDLLKQYKGDTLKALAAYNWGSGNLDQFLKPNSGTKFPAATQEYLSKYNEMQDIFIMTGAGKNAPISTEQPSSNETNIGTITVNTQATDADGMARDLRQSLSNEQLINNSVSGNK